MSYSFRNRIVLSDPLAAPDNNHHYVLSSDSASDVVELLGPHGEEPIQHAMELRLRGSGYETYENAVDAGKLWRNRLTVAFAHYEKGIQIGSDATPDQAEWSHGQPYFVYNLGRMMRDSPKLTVFPTNQEPSWGGLAAEGVVAHPIQTFINGPLAWVIQRDSQLNPQQELAYNLFHAAYFESGPEAQYILLFTAIEALIPKRFRANPYIKVLKQLRSYLETLDGIESSIMQSIREFLRYKDNESIRYRGRTWAPELLGDASFDGMTAEESFLHAYNTRNSLAHGNVDRPDPERLKAQIPELRRYLLALLDMDVFGELMPGLIGFNPDGSIRTETA